MSNTSATNVEIANEIIRQIKAIQYFFLASIGFNSPAAVENGVTFKVNGRKVGYAYVEIKLNAMDTYDVRVFKVRRVKFDIKVTELGKSQDVYSDNLVSVLSSLVDGKDL